MRQRSRRLWRCRRRLRSSWIWRRRGLRPSRLRRWCRLRSSGLRCRRRLRPSWIWRRCRLRPSRLRCWCRIRPNIRLRPNNNTRRKRALWFRCWRCLRYTVRCRAIRNAGQCNNSCWRADLCSSALPSLLWRPAASRRASCCGGRRRNAVRS